MEVAVLVGTVTASQFLNFAFATFQMYGFLVFAFLSWGCVENSTRTLSLFLHPSTNPTSPPFLLIHLCNTSDKGRVGSRCLFVSFQRESCEVFLHPRDFFPPCFFSIVCRVLPPILCPFVLSLLVSAIAVMVRVVCVPIK